MFAPKRTWDPRAMAQKLHAQQTSHDRRKKTTPTTTTRTAVSRPASSTHSQRHEPLIVALEHGDHADQDTHAQAAADHSALPGSNQTTPDNRSAIRQSSTPSQKRHRHRARSSVATPTKRTRYNSIRDDASLSMRRHNSVRRELYAAGRSDTVRSSSRIQERRGSSRSRSPGDRIQYGISLGGSSSERSSTSTQQTAISDGSTCDWCDSSFSRQPRHSCTDCPFELCSNCVINAWMLFPAHSPEHDCEKILPAPGTKDVWPKDAQDQAEMPDVSLSVEAEEPFTCALCYSELVELRYECQECENVNLCEEDRGLHLIGHSLKALRCEPRRDGSSYSAGDQVSHRGPEHRASGRRRSAHQSSKNSAGSGSNISYDIHRDEVIEDLSDMARERPDESDPDAFDPDELDPNESNPEVPNTNNSVADTSELDVISSGDEDDDEDDESILNSHGRDSILSDRNKRTARVTSIPARPRQTRRRRRPVKAPDVTLVIPADGLIVFQTWARAILDQAPIDLQREVGSRGVEGKRRNKPWLPSDQRDLSRLKAQGHSTAEIAETLGRTQSAITQQWRKQN